MYVSLRGHLYTIHMISVHLMYESLRCHLYTMLRGHLCTPFVCVVKGLPVHLTFVSLRGHLIKFFLELATQMCGILNLQRRHFAICFFQFAKTLHGQSICFVVILCLSFL